ncbi:MAG: hypothetical protein ACLQCU_06450 [Acidimicrobiales bacterium]
MRRLRIAAPAQLTLGIPDLTVSPAEQWSTLPTEAQEAVVCLLARMIAAGVVVSDEEEVGSNDAQH